MTPQSPDITGDAIRTAVKKAINPNGVSIADEVALALNPNGMSIADEVAESLRTGLP
jgi:hypothetical protein